MTTVLDRSLRRRDVLKLLAAAPLLAAGVACGSTAAGDKLTSVTIGLTYVPNIQFAMFYAADALGYFKDAGLKANLHHHTVGEDEFAAIAAGKENMIFAGGDETLQARSHKLDIVYVAELFNQSPVVLIVPQDSPIKTAADLKGHSVGIPGKYGSTYIGLLALLSGAGLSQNDIKIESIGFTQEAALLGHHVDSVVGYVNNDVIQFQKANFPVRSIPVTTSQPLISNGLATMQNELAAHPDVVRAVISATLKGNQYVIAHPQQAVNISKKYVPGLDAPAQSADALAVLQATIPLLQPGNQPGYSDPIAWNSMAKLLADTKQLASPVDPSQAFTNSYLPSSS